MKIRGAKQSFGWENLLFLKRAEFVRLDKSVKKPQVFGKKHVIPTTTFGIRLCYTIILHSCNKNCYTIS